MKKVDGAKKERLEAEKTHLINAIEPAQYRKYGHPFPAWLPEPGCYQNNLALVARFDLLQPTVIDGQTFSGSVFEFCFIRDDRELNADPSTKHINVGYRVLGSNDAGDIFQGSYRRGDHFISPVAATSMAYIEETLNLTGLPDTGPVDDLVKRGVMLELSNIQVDDPGGQNEK